MSRKTSASLMAIAAVFLAAGGASARTVQNPAPAAAKPYLVPASQEPHLSQTQMAALIHKKIRYVFVIYQENRSFDSYFGTFPGADGLFSQPESQTPGFIPSCVSVDSNVNRSGSAGRDSLLPWGGDWR